MPADISFTCDAPVARVHIAGDLDLDRGDELADVLESLASVGCTQVELDLVAVRFVDLPVLDMLRDEQRRLRASGGNLHVVAASRSFHEACEQAEVDSLLPEPIPERVAAQTGAAGPPAMPC